MRIDQVWLPNQYDPPVETRIEWYKDWMVVWNMNFIFPYIGFLIIPIDELIFFRGVAKNHQPEDCINDMNLTGSKGSRLFLSFFWRCPARKMGVPFKMLVVYFMENPTQMDDDWGYPYFRKLPYRCSLYRINHGTGPFSLFGRCSPKSSWLCGWTSTPGKSDKRAAGAPWTTCRMSWITFTLSLKRGMWLLDTFRPKYWRFKELKLRIDQQKVKLQQKRRCYKHTGDLATPNPISFPYYGVFFFF